MLRVHDASQGAGQILPVNSGKLLVECKSAIAFSHSPLYFSIKRSAGDIPL